MGNLVKTNSQALEIIKNYDFSDKLSNDECAIVRASLYPVVSKVEPKAFVTDLTKLITKTILDSGFKFEEEDKLNVILTIADDILRDFKHLTIEEIKICFRKGLRQEWGEYFGLSVLTFYGWLKMYCKEMRGKAIIKQREYEAEQERKKNQKEYTEEEKNKISYDAILWVYNHWLDNNNLFDIDNSTYESLVKFEIIKISREQKMDIFKRAKQKSLKKQTNEKPTSFKPRTKIQEIIKNIEAENKDGKWIIEKECKEIALIEFFESIKSKGSIVQFKKLLKEKLKIKQ